MHTIFEIKNFSDNVYNHFCHSISFGNLLGDHLWRGGREENPSAQSDNNLTIVYQVIVLGASVGSLKILFWGK